MTEEIRVLIIEDDPMVSHLNRLYTEKVPGFKVNSEINIDNNMQIENKDLENTDLLLLDIYLPGKDGLKILEEIRESRMDIDVIIISAAKDVQHINEAMHWGVVDYLIKPFTFERFKKSLLKYKEMLSSLNNKSNLQQKDIDSFLGNNKNFTNINKQKIEMELESDKEEKDNCDNNKYIRELPKGLNKETLSKIKDFLKNKEEEITTKKMAKNVGLSRVTAQRYLKYMASKNIVKVKREYGSVGRPRHYYKLLD